MAAKETVKAIKDVSLVTLAGSAEGTFIGTIINPGVGTIAGGIIGGATALSAELIARQLPKQTVTVHGKDTIVLPTTDASESSVSPESFSSQATETRENVPMIQVPDTIRQLRKIVLDKTSGRLRGERTEAAIVDNARAMNLVYLPHVSHNT